MDTGIIWGCLPAHEVAKVLEHVLGEEGGEGGHHARHEDHHGAQGLHRLQTLLTTLLALQQGGKVPRNSPTNNTVYARGIP